MLQAPSTIHQRRWYNFKRNRRGFYSLIVLAVCFVLSLGAEFIANDKPIIVAYDGSYYFPVFKRYAEVEFGGDFHTEADYRDPYVQNLITDTDKGNGWMVWPLIRYSYQTINYQLPTPAPSPPTSDNLLGTDDQGRDVLARTIYGFRVMILFALCLTIISSSIGIVAGALQGYYGGLFDLIFQRVIEVWSSLPYFYVIIILASFVVPNFWWLLLINILFGWTNLVGVVRAEFLKARNLDYVRAAKALGVGEITIIFRHVLPNAMVSAITFLPFILTGAVTALTVLDFLGFGLPAGSPSLGELLSQGKNNLNASWLGLSAFVTLATMLTLLMFIGEAVRDAFDPRKG